MSAAAQPRYALLSMPWFWAYLPSIQLAIVKDVLTGLDIESDVFEFYTDLTEATGIHLYKAIANDSGYTGELLFSQFYFEDFDQQYNRQRVDLGFATKAIQDDVFVFLTPVIEKFLDDCMAEVDWQRYDAICFSLTASQTAASMAMAKRIKAKFPDLPIIFGGSSCAGEMGEAILQLCPQVDFAVHGEAEVILPKLVAALNGESDYAEVSGISWRRGGTIVTNERAKLHALSRKRHHLDFDSYFHRVSDNKLLTAHGVWIPFESSRGCWYGEKAQCTFCGLNEIIQYRERGDNGLMTELEHYQDKYGVKNFFAVDLIMPRSFFSRFLPDVEKAEKGWTIFYEIKSNMRRTEIEQLAGAGVRWIQPGIESLSDNILTIMRKGVTAAHNIQTLRLAKEQGVTASWNLITGFPREKAEDYLEMVPLIPKLFHLDPPVGLGDFEVHRFSPYFQDPEKMGVALRGAYPIYDSVYPVDRSILDKLVYRYQYDLIDPPDPRLNESRAKIHKSVAEWRLASERHAEFSIEFLSDGTALLRDSRFTKDLRETLLTSEQAAFLKFLDEMRVTNRVRHAFQQHDPNAFRKIEGGIGVDHQLARWAEESIILVLSGYIQALPKWSTRSYNFHRKKSTDSGNVEFRTLANT